MGERTTLVYPALPGYEKIPMEYAGALAARAGFAPERADDIRTAVAEACCNAREHGTPPEGRITVQLEADAGRLVVAVRDGQRQPLVPDPAPAATGTRRGRGLFLIRQLADSCRSRIDAVGHLLELVFLKEPPHA